MTAPIGLIDAHAHLGASLFGVGNTVTGLLESMDRHEIERAVLVPIKPASYHLGPENDRIAAAVAAHPDRFAGLARVDPWQGSGAVDELHRCVAELGMIGLFLHPFEEQFASNSAIVHPLMRVLSDRGLPLMIAGGYPVFSHPARIGDLASMYPDVTIITTHGGQINISGELLGDALRVMRSCPNVVMETSGIYREDFIEDTVAELGAERVVWGSNTPYMDQGFETTRVRMAHLDERTKASIGRDTIRRLLNLD